MSVPSMVHRSGDTLVVRSVVSGDALFGSADDLEDKSNDNINNIPDNKELPECKVKRNYSCGSCDFFTQNPRSYLYHLRDVHKEKVRIYECPNCLYASKHFQKLIRHTRMVHGDSSDYAGSKKGRKRPVQTTPEDLDESNESPTSADESSQPSPSLDEEPETISTPTNNLTCNVCSFVAKSPVQLTKHNREEHIKTTFFRCTKCTYITHIKARFTKHVKYHSMPMIKCGMCDFRTPYKWNLDRHCKNHNGKGAFRCSACNFTADIKQSLTVHEMNHHVPPVGQAAGLGVGRRRNKVGASDTTAAEEAAAQVQAAESDQEPSGKTSKLKISAKKQPKNSSSALDNGSDFVHPDDIVQHANGNVYIKNKCRLCNFKTAWDGEMAKHEEREHGTFTSPVKKKPQRPIPKLIPIATQKIKQEPTMSQKDMNEICAKSINTSALWDFVSLLGSEDEFRQDTEHKMPDLLSRNPSQDAKRKLNPILNMVAVSGNASEILTCRLCGHKSSCVTESHAHKKICGKESMQPVNRSIQYNPNSTRCQHCRQRCKSSKDLTAHLQTCTKYFSSQEDMDEDDDDNDQLQIVTEDDNNSSDKEPHPMENKVFVWNKIETDVKLEEPASQYDYPEDIKPEIDNLSISTTRTHSPVTSENSNLEIITTPTPTPTPTPTTTDKIPTHGNDISVAQHKRVFKCPHCTFWASTASRFHVHIVGHLNKKPFECSLCAYRSNWRWDITKHIKLKSVRDKNHESAKVLMTDETGRRNYTKYNKYLTEINKVPGGSEQDQTSGGNGTRPKQHHNHGHDTKDGLPKAGKTPSVNDFGALLSKVTTAKPLPALRAADEFFRKVPTEKKQKNDTKKTLWQCRKCSFRDPSKEKLLAHVKGHVVNSPLAGGGGSPPPSSSNATSACVGAPGNHRYPAGLLASTLAGTAADDLDSEASVGGSGTARGQAPFRCGHCHQVSNWKHVIQRHCRLKHNGVIKVIAAGKGVDKMELDIEELPEHQDIKQDGYLKCMNCPFATDDSDEYQLHTSGHLISSGHKCSICTYSASVKEDLYQHFKLHGILNYNEFINNYERQSLIFDVESSKRYKCTVCPYDTNSKSQYTYHKQFHQPRNGQYTCTECSYNVTKRHLLHQHMKVHGISVSPQKQNGEMIDFEEMSDDIEEVKVETIDWGTLSEIPLVWVSKNSKLSKMYKCRYCPHVNLRKVNIQEHEKMHGLREKNPARLNETEHHCPECNYVCNNAGVLSSHSKVHQIPYGSVLGIVDSTRSEEEQIRELGHSFNPSSIVETEMDEESSDNAELLYFCYKCPARFLKRNEYDIHLNLHNSASMPYKCDYCSYTANKEDHITAHANVHSRKYNERTKALLESYAISPECPQPETTYLPKLDVFLTDDKPDIEVNKTPKYYVPLSGTELYQQKSRAEAASGKSTPELSYQNRKLLEQLIYSSSNKGGYRCLKCANSFETMIEYKAHMEKHEASPMLKRSLGWSDGPDIDVDSDEETPRKLPFLPEIIPTDPTKQFRCWKCPYITSTKESIEKHQKHHLSISGLKSEHMCQHCDYSVSDINYLRQHSKLHFGHLPNYRPDGYMSCDSLTIVKKNREDDEQLTFDGKDAYMCDKVSVNNNNESEKVYVDVHSGELMDTDSAS